jgi:hypothetical protein
VRSSDLVDDVEAEPDAARSELHLVLSAAERLEDVRAELVGNGRARIVDVELERGLGGG